MKRILVYLSLSNMLFIIILSISGAVSGILSETFYYLAFIIPFGLTLVLKKNLNMQYEPPRVKISSEGLKLTFAATAPILLFVFLISCLTDLILSPFGEGAVADVSGNLFFVIISQAVVTAVLEEMLFRYMPLSLLAPFSRRGAIIYSAAFFALVHCNLYQLPYAFIAGVLFAMLDLMCDSILPSVILHFINNLISIFWIRYAAYQEFATVYVLILVAFAAVSIPFLFALRNSFKDKLWSIVCGDGAVELSIESIVFALATISIAIINL